MTRYNPQGQSTSFIGRQAELAEIAALLADPGCRLLSLVGPGGIGKTRLAIEAAAHTAQTYPDGVYFVDLQSISSSENIVSTISEAIEFSFVGQEDPTNQLLYHLHGKSMLLVLDNFEHVLAGVDLLTTIVENTQSCQLLVTSREVLNLQSEWVFDVSGLQFPESDHVKEFERYGAIQLFIERARRVRSDFSPEQEGARIIHICQLTEGMPLAIELATSWLRTLSCAEIVSELQTGLDLLKTSIRDIPERHRSLQATFDQSWKQLTDDERVAFRRLTVFKGGFQREAAAQIADVSLTTLAALVDKSLLRSDNRGRYHIHELLRQFGEDKLRANPEELNDIHNRHSHYFDDFLYNRADGFWAGHSEERAVLREIENIRAAWRWSVTQGKFDQVRRFVPGIMLIHEVQNWWQEAALSFAWAAAEVGDDEHPEDKTKTLGLLLLYQSHFYRRVGMVEEGKQVGQRGLSLLNRTEPDEAHAWAFLSVTRQGMPVGFEVSSDHQKVKQMLLQGLAIFEKMGNQRGISWTLLTLGNVMLDDAKFEQGEKYYQRAMTLIREGKDDRGWGWAIWGLSRIALHSGDYEKSRDLLQQYLRLGKETDARRAWYVMTLGEIEFELENHRAATHHFCEILQVAVERPYMVQQRLDTMLWLCRLLILDNMPARAVEVLALVLRYAEDYQHIREPASQLLEELKDYLPPSLFEASVERGQALDMDDTIIQLLEWGRSEQDEEVYLSGNLSLVEPLTERELEILELIVTGMANKEIADRLFISVTTVKKHISHIYDKLGVKNRTQAVARARELEIF